jgi:hypothetical protein
MGMVRHKHSDTMRVVMTRFDGEGATGGSDA